MYKYIASKLYIYDSVLKIRGYIKRLIIKLTKGLKRNIVILRICL